MELSLVVRPPRQWPPGCATLQVRRRRTTTRLPIPKLERWYSRQSRSAGLPSLIGGSAVQIPLEFPLLSSGHPHRRIDHPLVPQLQQQEHPENIAVVGAIVRSFEHVEEMFDRFPFEVSPPESTIGNQRVARERVHLRVRFHPRRHRNSEPVFLLLDDLDRQQVA